MNQYFEQMVLGASPIELIRLLYQRGIRSVREAREHLAAGRIAERSAAITNAYAVIDELMSALKPEEAPELAQRLSALYCYIEERLLAANLQQSDAPLAEVLGLMTTLSEAWAPLPEPVKVPAAWMTPELGKESERVAFSG